MVSFRKFVLVLAVVGLVAGAASAQTTSCSAVASGNLLVRQEGLTEPVGNIIISCTAPSTGTGAAAASFIVRGATFTNSLLDDKTPPTTTALATSTVTSGGTTTTLDTKQGVLATANEVDFNDVTLSTASSTTTIITLSNVRVNANAAGAAGSQITLSVSGQAFTPGQSINVLPGTNVTVGSVNTGLNFSVKAASAAFPQCTATGSSNSATLTFAPGYAYAFRAPGTTGAVNPEPLDSTAGTKGVQLIAVFTAVGTNTTLTVDNTLKGVTGTGTATLISPTATTTGGATTTDIKVTGNTQTVIWQVATVDPANPRAALAGTVTIKRTSSGSVIGLGDVTVRGNLGPISTATGALPIDDEGNLVPRFADVAGTSSPIITVVPCATTLLFPYVVSQAPWETGIAISNTSKDPSTGTGTFLFGGKTDTTGQAGTCTLYYFNGTAGGANPATQTTASIAPGNESVFLIGSGSATDAGVGPVPEFAGYVLAQCNFLNAHGFAFGTSGTANLGAFGYNALVVTRGNVTKDLVESLGQ